MATHLQRKLAKAIIEDSKNSKKTSGGALLKSVGYSEASAIGHTSELLEAKGVKEALEEFGFTEENAKRVVTKILNHGKEENQLKAADMIFKTQGSYAPEKHMNLNVELETSQEVRALTEKLNALYGGSGESGDGALPGSVDDQAQDKE